LPSCGRNLARGEIGMLAEEPQLAGLVRGEELGASARNSLENTGTGSKKRGRHDTQRERRTPLCPRSRPMRGRCDTFSRPDVRT
jgi:hypothetical protein